MQDAVPLTGASAREDTREVPLPVARLSATLVALPGAAVATEDATAVAARRRAAAAVAVAACMRGPAVVGSL
jgi:hypothetical protein